LRAWLRLPDVVADPEQTEDGRVWTRAQDVLPGVVVREGTALTAAWGDRVWTVLPVWADDEPDGLWLENLDEPSGPPDPQQAYPLRSLVDSLDGACRADIEAALSMLVSDFADSLKVVADAHRLQRRWAAALIDDLEQLSAATSALLDELPTGHALRALARRPFGFGDDTLP
jgi:hypothetical protein